MNPSIEEIINTRKILDSAKAPTYDRRIRMVGKDGKIYEFSNKLEIVKKK